MKGVPPALLKSPFSSVGFSPRQRHNTAPRVPINTHRDIVLRSAPHDMQRRVRLRSSLSRELHFRTAGVPPALLILLFSGTGTLVYPEGRRVYPKDRRACALLRPAASAPFTQMPAKVQAEACPLKSFTASTRAPVESTAAHCPKLFIITSGATRASYLPRLKAPPAS
jgi:hypothetical protein